MIEPLLPVGNFYIAKAGNTGWSGLFVPFAVREIAYRKMPFQVHSDSGIATIYPGLYPFRKCGSTTTMYTNHCRPSAFGRSTQGCFIISKYPGWFCFKRNSFIKKGTHTCYRATTCFMYRRRLIQFFYIPWRCANACLLRMCNTGRQEQRKEKKLFHG